MGGDPGYKFLSKFYDLFDGIFWFGGKGNPRSGLLTVIGNEPLRVLDVCVGTAASALAVAARNDRNRVTGIDLSDEMLAVARRKIAGRQVKNIDVCSMSADRLEFPPGSFDIVMISFALHEFEADLREGIFREVSRVLKTGGLFCVIDFARQPGWWNGFFIRLWTTLEPPCFSEFLRLDWASALIPYRFQLRDRKEFSFSNLYVLEKV